MITCKAMAIPTQSELNTVKLAMAATNKTFTDEVVRNRNIAALDEVYTEDARILPPGAPMISGRAAIKEFWSGLIQAVNPKSCVLESVDVIPAGDCVVEIGRAMLQMEPEGQGPAEMQAKYVVCWRQEDNRWKWQVDIWNETL